MKKKKRNTPQEIRLQKQEIRDLRKWLVVEYIDFFKL